MYVAPITNRQGEMGGNKDWYAAHREEAKARQRAYYAANKERLKDTLRMRQERLAKEEALQSRQAKRCSICGEEKSIEEFARDAQKVDGRRSSCKVCHSARVKGYYHRSGGDSKSRPYRKAASSALGRKLERGEHVHHVNMDHGDNVFENLWVCTGAAHRRAEGSLFRLVKPLMERGVVVFDRAAGEYRLVA